MPRTAAEKLLRELPLDLSPRASINCWLEAYRICRGDTAAYTLVDFLMAEINSDLQEMSAIEIANTHASDFVASADHFARLVRALADVQGKPPLRLVWSRTGDHAR